MVYTASIGSRLGEFDVGRVRDLSLPTIATAPGLAEPVAAKPTKATATPSEPATTKFQLGETLPVVPVRIVRRILKGDFVDMAELTEENLEKWNSVARSMGKIVSQCKPTSYDR